MNLLLAVPLLFSAFLPEPLVGTWRVPHETNDGIQITVNLWASGDADGFIVVDPENRTNKSKRSWRGSWNVKSNKAAAMVLTLEGVSQVFGSDAVETTSFWDNFTCEVSELSKKRFQCSTKDSTTDFIAVGR